MCGRYTLFAPPEDLARIFRLPIDEVRRVFMVGPRYNIAPTDDVLCVRVRREAPAAEPVLLRWGLLPHWSKDRELGARTINARAETVADRPAYRDPFRERRCLVVADGFYEWEKLPTGKQPLFIRLRDESPFAFAGLWDRWEGADRSVVESCTIITTEANALLRPIHERMPVILRPSDHEVWLDPALRRPHQLLHLLRPYPADHMVAHPVSTLVNKAGNDRRECIEPVGPPLAAPDLPAP